MKPEEKARQKIDQWFADAGWEVRDRNGYEANLTAVAIREGRLKNRLEADYLLFIDGKAIGVLEAKSEEINVSSQEVTEQVERYARSVPHIYPTYQTPLPFLYKSNGGILLFRDFRNPGSDYERVSKIHTPRELAKELGITDPFAGLPFLDEKGLHTCQYEAVTALEESFRAGQRRALIVLATGAGKTYTACLAAYRMLSYTPMRRILFLVDRNNLGKQAEEAFGTFRLTETRDAFNTIFSVNRLRGNDIPKESNVIISTIQRLFAFLRGEPIEDTDNDGGEPTEEVSLPPNASLPHDYFDMIIVDECHRSIYGIWRKVLEYFNTARFVGLTATPILDTKAFFNKNCIINYTLEQSILDGVNVNCRTYRIKTKVTENGGAIREGDKVQEETRYTGEVKELTNKEETTYTRAELNRSIVNPAQIKLILETYRDKVYTEMFNDPPREPNMDYLPKTLIFALNEIHADNIVQIAREVFGKSKEDPFVQKITYSVGDSNELIRRFRNDVNFRIAVTCTLVATGTDVKPIEVVMFLRDVESDPFYVQMKGRGVRTISDDALQAVTPNARSKDCFFLVDAVGVTEHKKTTPTGTEPAHPTITLKELLEKTSYGYLPDEYLRCLAGKLAWIYHHKAKADHHAEFKRLAGVDMKELASEIFNALKEDKLPPFNDVNDPNDERKGLVAPLADHAPAREYLLTLNAGFVRTITTGEDELIFSGFTTEEAEKTTHDFEEYCHEHADEIEALRILYNQEGRPITYPMLQDLRQKLILANSHFDPASLWNAYATINSGNVTRATTKKEREALTNIIQLVRYAYRQMEKLSSLVTTAHRYYNLWLGHLPQRDLSEEQRDLLFHIVDDVASNGVCTLADIRQYDRTQAAQMVHAFDSTERADKILLSLYQFVILGRSA